MYIVFHGTNQIKYGTRQQILDLLQQYSDRHKKFIQQIVAYDNDFMVCDDNDKKVKAIPKITIEWELPD